MKQPCCESGQEADLGSTLELGTPKGGRKNEGTRAGRVWSCDMSELGRYPGVWHKTVRGCRQGMLNCAWCVLILQCLGYSQLVPRAPCSSVAGGCDRAEWEPRACSVPGGLVERDFYHSQSQSQTPGIIAECCFLWLESETQMQ